MAKIVYCTNENVKKFWMIAWLPPKSKRNIFKKSSLQVSFREPSTNFFFQNTMLILASDAIINVLSCQKDFFLVLVHCGFSCCSRYFYFLEQAAPFSSYIYRDMALFKQHIRVTRLDWFVFVGIVMVFFKIL